MYYERYVLGEITLDEFKVKHQKLRPVAEDQKAIEHEIEEYEQDIADFLVSAKSEIRSFLFQ